MTQIDSISHIMVNLNVSEVETRCPFAVGSSTDVEHVPLGTLQLVVGHGYSRRTGPTIFLILYMHVPYHKGKKRARPFFREKSGSLIIHEKRFPPFSRL